MLRWTNLRSHSIPKLPRSLASRTHSIPAREHFRRRRWANTCGQPTGPNPVKQIGSEDAQSVRQGAMEPLGMQRVHTDLLADPFPRPALGINARANRQQAARLARESGEAEGLAKKVKIKFWIPGAGGGGGSLTPRSTGHSDSGL